MHEKPMETLCNTLSAPFFFRTFGVSLKLCQVPCIDEIDSCHIESLYCTWRPIEHAPLMLAMSGGAGERKLPFEKRNACRPDENAERDL